MRLITAFLAASAALLAITHAQHTTPVFRFTIVPGTLTGCDKFTLNFTTPAAAKAPFQLTAFPDSNEVYTWNITAFNETVFGGSIQLPLPYRTFKNKDASQNQRIVFVMSDAANGFGSGGVSDILKVGNTKSNNYCAYPPNQFYYGTAPDYGSEIAKGSLKSCDNLTITWGVENGFKNVPNGAVTAYGVVPNTGVWVIASNTDQTAVNVPVIVQSGTNFMLGVVDQYGGSGGSLNVTVNAGTSTCMNGAGPNASWSTAAPLDWDKAMADAIAANGKSGSKGGLSSGATIGIAVGVILGVILLLGLLGIVFWKRRKAKKSAERQSMHRREDSGAHLLPVNMIVNSSHAPAGFMPQTGSLSGPGTYLSRPSMEHASMSGMSDVYSRLSMSAATDNRASYLSSSPDNAMLSTASRHSMSPGHVSHKSLPGATLPPPSVPEPREPQFTYHQDAGEITPTPPPRLNIDVPPTYNPAWSASPSQDNSHAANIKAVALAALAEKRRP